MTQFLRQEGLELLIPLFRARSNTQAYGPVDDIPALYVMAWNHPGALIPSTRSRVPCGKYGSYQALADRLIDSLGSNVRIRFGSHVRYVVRGRRSAKVVLFNGSSERFNKVIVTTKLPETAEERFTVVPILWKEWKLAKAVRSTGIYTVLFEGPREKAIAKDRFIAFDGTAISGTGTDDNFYGAATQETRYDVIRHSDPKTIARETFFSNRNFQKKLVAQNVAEKERFLLQKLRTWDDTPWKAVRGFSFTRYFQR